MKRFKKFLGIMIATMLTTQVAFAEPVAINPAVVLTEGQQNLTADEHSSGSSAQVQLEGEIKNANTRIISVIVPTKVSFNMNLAANGWNKIVSPSAKITNIGNTRVDIFITGVSASGGISLVKTVPTGMKQVRLAFAPTNSSYSGINALSNYLIDSNVWDYNSVKLTGAGGLDFTQGNSEANYSVYGDASSQGWYESEKFGVTTMFKIAAIN